MAQAAVGIDLGTTFSCVGIFRNQAVEIIANDMGFRITPSYVSFTADDRLIGEAAKYQGAVNAVNTVFDAKRLIGRNFDDQNVQQDMKHWPFQVVNVGGKPKIKVKHAGEEKLLYPEEVSAMILGKMKETAEKCLSQNVVDVVVTVPAYFNDAQRQATKDAGTIAGLNVLKIINEPTAAALAYGLNKNPQGEKNILIFDLGGGTFDVSILTISNGMDFEVKAVAGDTHLGGEDFDNRMVDHFLEEFKRKHSRDPSKNSTSVYHLRTACERAKRVLSGATRADVIVPSFFEGIDFKADITRAKFENLCIDLFKNTIEHVQKALRDAKLDKSSIDDVVLVGGSTRIPKVQTLLQKFFDGKELCMSINPDEAVAFGATIQAALLTRSGGNRISDIVLVDVTPLSLGIEVKGGLMSNVVDRNSRIPCKSSKPYTTVSDNQDRVGIEVYEGERALVKDNHFLGQFTLSDLKPAPKGIPSIEVTFSLDSDGILHVCATEVGTETCNSIRIKHEKGCLSSEEIERMIKESKKFEDRDKTNKERVIARNNLEDYVYSVMHEVEDSSLPASDIQRVKRCCDSTMAWLEGNPLSSKDEINDKKESFRCLMTPYLLKI